MLAKNLSFHSWISFPPFRRRGASFLIFSQHMEIPHVSPNRKYPSNAPGSTYNDFSHFLSSSIEDGTAVHKLSVALWHGLGARLRVEYALVPLAFQLGQEKFIELVSFDLLQLYTCFTSYSCSLFLDILSLAFCPSMWDCLCRSVCLSVWVSVFKKYCFDLFVWTFIFVCWWWFVCMSACLSNCRIRLSVSK